MQTTTHPEPEPESSHHHDPQEDERVLKFKKQWPKWQAVQLKLSTETWVAVTILLPQLI